MIVECAKCGTRFRLDEAKIGQRGARVRCSKCQHSFVVQRPASDVQEAPESGFDPDSVPTTRLFPPSLGGAAPATEALGEAVPATEALGGAAPATEALGEAAPATEAGFAVGGDNDPGASSVELAGPHSGLSADFEPPAQPLDPGPDPQGPASSQGDVSSMPPPSALSDTPLAAPELSGFEPPVPGDPIHEAQTAIYSVPELMRFPTGEQQSEGGTFVAPTEQEEPTNLVPVDVLLRVKAETAEDASKDLQMVEADLVDDSDVMLVSDGGEDLGDFSLSDNSGDFGDLSLNGGLAADGSFFPPEGQKPVAVGRIEPATVSPKSDNRRSLASTVPAPQVSSTTAPARARWSLGVKLVTTVAGLAILTLGVMLYLGGGRWDPSAVGIGRSGGGQQIELSYKDVHPISMRSLLYPTYTGKRVLVFVGNAENHSREERQHIAAVAELRDRSSGRVVASARGPVGLALGPGEIARLTDSQSLAAAYTQLATRYGEPRVSSHAAAPFTVVLLDPPSDLLDLQHLVRLEMGEPVIPPPPPEPEVDEVREANDKTKGKRKRRGKRKRKGKRRAHLPLERE